MGWDKMLTVLKEQSSISQDAHHIIHFTSTDFLGVG
jgi:hypothetical protein